MTVKDGPLQKRWPNKPLQGSLNSGVERLLFQALTGRIGSEPALGGFSETDHDAKVMPNDSNQPTRDTRENAS